MFPFKFGANRNTNDDVTTLPVEEIQSCESIIRYEKYPTFKLWWDHANPAEVIMIIGTIYLMAVILAGAVLYMTGYFSSSSPSSSKIKEDVQSSKTSNGSEQRSPTLESTLCDDCDSSDEKSSSGRPTPFSKGSSNHELDKYLRSVANVRKEILSMSKRNSSRKHKRNRSFTSSSNGKALVVEVPRPRARSFSKDISTLSFSSSDDEEKKELIRKEDKMMEAVLINDLERARHRFDKLDPTPRRASLSNLKSLKSNLGRKSLLGSSSSEEKSPPQITRKGFSRSKSSAEEIRNHKARSRSNNSTNTSRSHPDKTKDVEKPLRRTRSLNSVKASEKVIPSSNQSELSAKLSKANTTIETLKTEKESLNSSLEENVNKYKSLEKEYFSIQTQLQKSLEIKFKYDDLQEEIYATKAHWQAMASKLEKMKSTQLKHETVYKEETKALQKEVQIWKNRCKDGYINVATDALEKNGFTNDPSILNAQLQLNRTHIADLESKLFAAEEIRKSMHNRIQELRGNIRLYVRVRPFVGKEAADSSAVQVASDGQSLTVMGGKYTANQSYDFSFDKIFDPASKQSDIFGEVSDLIQSALDGYHVCLFSYGQTGSGKTHTMQGNGTGELRGIIPRAVEKILSQTISMRETQKWNFNLTVSFLEIYNDDLRDLLVTGNNGSVSAFGGSSLKTSQKLAIKRTSENKRAFVDGLSKVEIDNSDYKKGMEQLQSIMVTAGQARSVAATTMNAQSSRSHSVFTLEIKGVNEDTGCSIHGSLNLCDLAGSERLKPYGCGYKANEKVSREKETKNINKSLSCLGDVFTALANGSSHVPYRNSKLTYLLQDCLSGDGKALMFVNLSPSMENTNESLCSLRFAQRVSQIELGKATKNYLQGRYSK